MLAETYKYRTLVRALVTRHLAMRYRGSVLGFLWSFLNPLFLMAVYVLVFRYYMRFDGVPNYTLFVFVGLLPWLWTSSALSEGASAITSSGHLVTKSMFPAHILPTVSVTTTGVHFLLSLSMLFLYMLVSGAPFHLTILLLPLVCLIHALLLYGLVMTFATLNVRYRDVQHMLGNALTLIFFLSPILYPPDRVPEGFRVILALNPVALMTELYHAVMLDGRLPGWDVVGRLSIYIIAFLVLGRFAYRTQHERFAELL